MRTFHSLENVQEFNSNAPVITMKQLRELNLDLSYMIANFNRSDDKKTSLRVLADLNGVSPDAIREILILADVQGVPNTANRARHCRRVK